MAGERPADADAAGDGLLVVAKPAGMTSHDVVARVRRLGRVRKVGHAGTLDPMATGVLVLGVGRATRLLGYLSGSDKAYTATVRLGQRTVTDDAEGEVVGAVSAGGVTDRAVTAELAAFRGTISQVPSAVSAVKVGGRRAYRRVRDGERVELAPRQVTVSHLAVRAVRRPRPDLLDVDIELVCSAGTYVRALARDLGEALGVGGHLTALRRTAAGGFTLAEAITLEALAQRAPAVVTLPLSEAARRGFPHRQLTAAQARVLRHGGFLPPIGQPGPYAAFAPTGEVVAIVVERDGAARPDAVLAPATGGAG